MSGESGGLGPFLSAKAFGFNPFDLHDFVFEWMAEWGISRGITLLVIFLGLLSVLAIEVPNTGIFVLGWMAGTAPIWLPVVLWIAAWKAWVNYVRSLFLSTRHPIVLEVKIPREIMKSPRAMQVVFSNLHMNTGETTAVGRGWKGTVRPWFSFEIASFGGEIHFYVWCWKAYKNFIEATIYSQYPEVEIVEVPDYISTFRYDPDVHNCFVGDYIYFGHKAAQGEPADEYPIKTYIDFELDKDPKEEHKVDPLATVFEMYSMLKPHEMAWMQMNIRFASFEGVLIKDKNDWVERVKKQVEKIRVESATFSPDTHLTEEQARSARPRGTWRQTEMIEAMERHLGQIPFEVGMRHMYISKGPLDGPTYTSLRWIYKPFNSPAYFNYIRSRRWHNDFDFPWQDFKGIRWKRQTRQMLDAMRRRSYFYTPWKTPHITMSPEMMATLYHYPSSTVKSPGLQRITAKKIEPPPNLPR
jgi:hypothetical protein